VGVNEVYDAFDRLRKTGARIVSCAEIRPTLEEYFMKLISKGDQS
jgi:hypothetical protein